jgi:heat shock protein HslJ
MLALIGTGLLALCACGNEAGAGAGSGSGAGSDAGAALAGRTFVSTSIVENGKPRPLLPGTQARVQFTTNGRISWNAGCNSSETSVSTADQHLSLGTEITSTLMGCPGDRQEQDGWMGGVLTKKPSWKLDGSKLVLTTSSTTISLIDKEAVTPKPALDATKWKLTTAVTGTTASNQAGFAKVWLTLNGERVTGSTGCNEFQGTVARSAGQLTFGELATTRRACTGDAATVEALVLKALKGDLAYRIDGSTLSLRNANGGLDFTATR